MKAENAIEVRNVTKGFKVYYDKGNTIKEKVLFSRRRKFENRLVLDDISFEVKKGEAVGLIGHNGCGKSTTLKLLTRIMYPDSGTIEMRGRVSSLIELGAGFHPDMSGRENIYINASIFGLTRKEIEGRLQTIIEFSELEDFIDNPVRTYSSGMYMRLAFSVAINVDADILLVDEILAVGDANFQSKCFNKLREIKAQGTTIVIVSHSLNQIEQICERSIWINEGKIASEGSPRDVHPQYMDYMGQTRLKGIVQKPGDEIVIQSEDGLGVEVWKNGSKIRWGNGLARITQADMFDKDGHKCEAFQTGDKLEIRVHYEVKSKVEDAVLGIGIFRSDGVQCYGTNTSIERFERFDLANSGEYVFKVHQLELLPGEYFIDLTLEQGMGIPVDYYTKVLCMNVYSDFSDVGVCRVTHTWVR